MDRGERRRRTEAVAARRRAQHLRAVHGGDTSAVDCVCELATFYFDTRRALGCRCSKHKSGSPRGPGGAYPVYYEVLPPGPRGVDEHGRAVSGQWRTLVHLKLCKTFNRDHIYAARHQWRMWSWAARAGNVDLAEEPAAPRA